MAPYVAAIATVFTIVFVLFLVVLVLRCGYFMSSKFFWQPTAATNAAAHTDQGVTRQHWLQRDVEAAAPALNKRPVPQAIIETFPTHFYSTGKLPTTAAPATATVHTTDTPGQQPAPAVGGPTAAAVPVSAACAAVEAPGVLPLAATQDSRDSVDGGPASEGQADVDIVSGVAEHLVRVSSSGRREGYGWADSAGTGAALGAALRMVGRALSGQQADVDDSLCAVSKNTCAICLGEYEEGEELRRLPCQHCFHRPCIDAWMASNHTCPICRLDLTGQQHTAFWLMHAARGW